MDYVQLFSLEDIPKRVDASWPRKPGRPKNVLDEAREFGGWTLSKLEVLRLYLKVYRRVAGSGTYLDAFAGDGRIRVDELETLGSASIAIESEAFRSLHLIELDADLHRRLDHHLRSKYTLRRRKKITLHSPADCNTLIPQLIAQEVFDPDRPCFAFLDPDSTQLAWSTLEALAGFKSFDATTRSCKTELWILFNTHQVVQRMWPNDRAVHRANPNQNALDRMMGGREAWADLYSEGRPLGALVDRYSERLMEQLGYRWVVPQVIKDPTTGAPQYHMVHATDHPAAIDLMRWAKSTSATEKSLQLEFPL